jgi:hypothetical protein
MSVKHRPQTVHFTPARPFVRPMLPPWLAGGAFTAAAWWFVTNLSQVRVLLDLQFGK